MATPTENSVPLTSDPLKDGLLQGSSWQFGGGPHVLTYSLSLNDSSNGGPWTPTLTAAMQAAFTQWSNVANLTFVESGSGTPFYQSTASIAVAPVGNDLNDPSVPGDRVVGLGIFPSATEANGFYPITLNPATGTPYNRSTWPQPEGDIALNNSDSIYTFLSPGGAAFEVMMHEIGHALGLKHPEDDGDNGRPTFAALGISQYDSNDYTLMVNSVSGSETSGQASTPMLLDILAIQRIYGANMSYHTGNDTYALSAPSLHFTIWDAGGNDTIDASGWTGTGGVRLDLTPGAFSGDLNGAKHFAIAYDVTIENAIGTSFDDLLIGNDAANVLTGGAGNDTYVVSNPATSIVELPGGGTDTVQSSVSFTLSANVENLTLTGNAPLTGTGNGLNNTITANSGGDVIDGGPGADTMYGGAGDDMFIVDNPADTVNDFVGGHDIVLSSVSYSLVSAFGVYDLTLTGSANINGAGNFGNNVLTSNSGIDALTGYGGDDTYVVNNSADVIVENPGDGIDTVESTVSYTLPANVENVTLEGTANINATGNDLDNVLTGNSGDNILDGGAGFDTMIGGPGNDTYVVAQTLGSPGDLVSALSLINWSASPINLTSQTGTFSYTLGDSTGDGLVDTIQLFYNGGLLGPFAIFDISTRDLGVNLAPGTYTGAMRWPFESAGHPGLWIAYAGSGANTSTGSFTITKVDFDYSSGTPHLTDIALSFTYSGDGGPVVTGTLTADTLTVAGEPEHVTEQPNEGIDTVLSSISYALPANVENLTLTGHAGLAGTGNELDNVINGNDGDNVLTGGLGNDTLIGGAGFDTADFAGSRTGYSLTKNGATSTISGPDGTDTLSGIERLQFSDATIRVGASMTDVNGDGKSDIISRPIGEVDIWQMDGSQITASSAWGAGSLWQVPEAHGDYNGDGKSDILLTTIGDVYIWQMDGTQITTSGGFGASSAWQLVGGVGDFNGDGKSDIMLRHDDGDIGIWFMNGVNIAGAGFFHVDTSWTVAGSSGDYNGDGKSDLLLTRPGEVGVMTLDGAQVTDSASFGASTSWSVVGTRGDYNGDGKSDILLQNHDSGALAIWLMDGTHIIGSGSIDTGHPDWVIASSDADFNGDGKSDLLIRENGEVGVWEMNGTQVLAQANWGASSFWTLHAGTADYNADGKSDVVLENPAGDVVQWLMNGVNIDHSTSFHISPGTDFLI